MNIGSAHCAVGKARREGILIPLPCAVCGSPNSVAHHEDYSKPLEVVWLCQKHHVARHRKLGWGISAHLLTKLTRVHVHLDDKHIAYLDGVEEATGAKRPETIRRAVSEKMERQPLRTPRAKKRRATK